MWRYEPNTLLNADCLPVMREMPDKFFQLAIVDPPYGIGNDGQKKKVRSNPKQSRKEHEQKDWDSKGIPGQNTSGSLKEYLKIRLSGAAIIL